MTPEILTADAESARFQCRYIFTDGRRCGSPALRSAEGPESFCYYHHNSRRPIQDAPTRKRRQSRFALPNPEDRSAIQQSIGEVLRRIASNEIDPRRAGLLLYGLQIASLNLPKSTPADTTTEPVSEITHDPEHGILAPPAELHSNEPKSSLETLLDDLDKNTSTIDLQASDASAESMSTRRVIEPSSKELMTSARRISDTVPLSCAGTGDRRREHVIGSIHSCAGPGHHELARTSGGRSGRRGRDGATALPSDLSPTRLGRALPTRDLVFAERCSR